MKTDNEIDCYTINGKDTKVGDQRKLHVRNVWNASKLVELSFEGNSIIVHESELIKAIYNSTNNEVK